jgi:hypothetical protein
MPKLTTKISEHHTYKETALYVFHKERFQENSNLNKKSKSKTQYEHWVHQP